MASTSLLFATPRSPFTSRRCFTVRPITATLSKPTAKPAEPSKLPVRDVPGDYGLPFIGPIMDRLDYFYNQGRHKFFKSRMEKYKSTVFKANTPPGPFISQNHCSTARTSWCSSTSLKSEKKDLFSGTYMPSIDLTGGYRILSYLDLSEPYLPIVQTNPELHQNLCLKNLNYTSCQLAIQR
ncbi:allene oxide synthase [Actinidia rufa]|uniref:Allene oxide synthase n=1 Tax=Actinidia rufa TaxID=165716 RepID=A0A7J0FB19_9ERIC|nr:allene oxide synthase [Actinidia rufa]